jgi:hypothetical protein
MKTLITIFLCLFAFNAYAAPFVVSDAYPAADTQPDGFLCTLNTGAVQDVVADVVTPTTKRLKYDAVGAISGSNTLKIKAYKNDALWGRLESAEVNFTFPRPAAPSGATGVRLAP